MPQSKILTLDDADLLSGLLGHRDTFARQISDFFTVDIHARGHDITINGDPLDVAGALRVLEAMVEMLKAGRSITSEDVLRACEMARSNAKEPISSILMETILRRGGGKAINLKTPRQKLYVELIRSRDIVFGVGPAGTGKTYLAMAMAVQALLDKKVRRIVLTRPAVEAGEKLGFLPGDMREKVSPYLRPLYDALYDMLDDRRVEYMTARGIIEVAPLAFMRGRTLNDSFVILDEAQNTTREQMKMLLTRLGYGSKAVITGDTSQIDLERKSDSGLSHALRIFADEPEIGVCAFKDVDVVRHPLVKRVIAAYDRDDAQRAARRAAAEAARAVSAENEPE